MIAVDLVRANRKLVRIDAIGRLDLLCTVGLDRPRVLRCLLPCEVSAGAVLYIKILDVPRIFADQIASRRPNGHLEVESFGHLVPFDAHLDLEQMRPGF